MNSEGHSSSTCTMIEILKIHLNVNRVDIHAWVEWYLTEIDTKQHSVFILSSINTNDVSVTIEIRIWKATEDRNILNIGMCKFFDFVTCLEFICPCVVVVIRCLWVTYSNYPSRRGWTWNRTIDRLDPPFKGGAWSYVISKGETRSSDLTRSR